MNGGFLAITAVVMVAGALLWPAIMAGAGLVGLEGVGALMAGGALLGAATGGMQQALTNVSNGRPWDENLGQAVGFGAASGVLLTGVLGRLGFLDGALASAGEDAFGASGNSLSDLGMGDARVSTDGLPVDEGAGGAGGCSFSADTQVATPSGEQSISHLKVGDQVIAYNPATGQSEAEPIQHVWVNHDRDLVDVGLTSEVNPASDAHAAATPASGARSSGHAVRAVTRAVAAVTLALPS